jgi:hypothetical protein
MGDLLVWGTRSAEATERENEWPRKPVSNETLLED